MSVPSDGWQCPSCGPVGQPIHGSDERMHCPELDCDAVVSFGMPERTGVACQVCGEDVPLSRGSQERIYCSVSCRASAAYQAMKKRRERPRPPCPVCGEVVPPSKTRPRTYCSTACRGAARKRSAS